MEEQPACGFSRGEQEEPLSGDDLATLRSLLFGPEQRNIRALRERLENRELRTEDVSAVVAEAIRVRHTRGGREILIEALTPSVIGALRESARKDPTTLSEAFFPVVGPVIRRSLTQYIQSLLEPFNNALEHSLSLQSLRWRMEALRTGKSFAELVLLHNLIYRVEQILSRRSWRNAATLVVKGLVIEIVGHSDNTGAEAWNRLLKRAAGEWSSS